MQTSTLTGTDSRAAHLYLNSVIWMSVPSSAAATNAANAPGRSGMLVAKMASARAPTLASSATSARRSKFMLAPLVTATAATPCAPAGRACHCQLHAEVR